MGSWLRHRLGGVGLRSGRPGITGPWGRRCRGTRGPARSREQAWVGEQECTQIGKNGLSGPFWGICVHCCAIVDRRGDAGVYTDWRKWPLGSVLGHLCTLLRRELRRELHCELRCELRRELRRVARVAQPPWRAGGAPSVVASPLVGKTGSARVAPPLVWRCR